MESRGVTDEGDGVVGMLEVAGSEVTGLVKDESDINEQISGLALLCATKSFLSIWLVRGKPVKSA